VPSHLQAAQQAELLKMADVKAVCSRVETDVAREVLTVKKLSQFGIRDLMDQPAEFEILE
jgi:hypothetical protein